MARSCKVIAVIPAYNEEKTIKLIVNSLLIHVDVVVVNDGSTDKTSEEVLSTKAILLNNQHNMGYEWTIDIGFQYAFNNGYTHVVTIDADGQHKPELINEILVLIENGSDLIIGNRDNLPRFSEKLFSFYTQYKYGISDPCSGLKAYSTSIYKERGYFDSYRSSGTELFLFGVYKGYSFASFNYLVLPREDASRFGGLFKANFRIFRALLKAIWGAYK